MKKSNIYKVLILTLFAHLLLLSGCVNYKQLEVNDFKIEKLSPIGLTSAALTASVLVDNPSCSFSISDISAVLHRADKEYCTLTAAPIEIAAKTEAEYGINGKLNLGQGVSVLEVLSMLKNFNPDEFTVDLYFKVKPKGGAAKKFKYEDVPLKYVVEILKSQAK